MNFFTKILRGRKQPTMDTPTTNANAISIDSEQIEDSSYWDAERLIDALTDVSIVEGGQLCIHTIDDNSNPQWIKIQRIYSVMLAYDKYASDSIGSKIYITPSYLMSATLSPYKKMQIETLLNDMAPCDEALEIAKNQSFKHLFAALLVLYVSLKTASNPFSGVLECSHEVHKQLHTVQTLIDINLVPLEEKIKKLLALLMGDDYDNPISVKDLINQFDYPNISDDTIRQMEIDWEVG